MALNLANVELTDTFNTWRIRTNSVIGEAVSGTSSTPQSIATNLTVSGNVTATSFIGDGSQLTNAGSTVGTGTNNADLLLPFTGITTGTMTTANVDTNLTYNPSSGTLSANIGSFDTVTTGIVTSGSGNVKIQREGTDRVEATAGGGSLYGTWTVTEGLTVDGPAVFNGNTTIVQSTVIETTDGLIHLASNNEVSDTLDIGFFGHYYNGVANQHAGVFRDSGTKEFYIFNEYSPGFEPENDINIAHGSFALANVHAAFYKGDGSALTGITAGATIATQSTGNVELLIPFTGITSGTMTTANVNSTLAFNPLTNVLTLSGTGAIKIPSGNTSQRTTDPVAGHLRFNTDTTTAEIYNGTEFVAVGGAAAADENYGLITAADDSDEDYGALS